MSVYAIIKSTSASAAASSAPVPDGTVVAVSAGRYDVALASGARVNGIYGAGGPYRVGDPVALRRAAGRWSITGPGTSSGVTYRINRTVQRGSGTRRAADIIDPLVVSDAQADARGARYLDDPSQGGNWLTTTRSLKGPHEANTVIPGKWITVTCSRLGLSAVKMRVRKYTITGNRVEVWASAELDTYTDPEAA